MAAKLNNLARALALLAEVLSDGEELRIEIQRGRLRGLFVVEPIDSPSPAQQALRDAIGQFRDMLGNGQKVRIDLERIPTGDKEGQS